MIPQSIGFETQDSTIKSLGTRFGFTESDIFAFFQIRTAEMLSAYIEFNLIWDNIFALLYGTMYAVWLSALLKASERKMGIVNLLPFLQVIFDWLENYSLAQLAEQYLSSETLAPNIAKLSSVFVTTKWVCSGLTFIALFLAMSFLVVRLFKTK